MDKKVAIEKIKKCLALSKSNEPNEAAAALRQASALMRKYGVSEVDLTLSDVKESASTAGRATATPPAWMAGLANIVAAAFGVSVFYSVSFLAPSQFVFVGVDPAHKIADYTFAVMRRQCTAARSNYYKSTRGKRVNRVRRSDAYATGWVMSVQKQIQEFAQPVPNMVGQYLQINYPKTETINRKNKLKPSDNRDISSGYLDGNKVQLHHGMNGQNQQRIETSRA